MCSTASLPPDEGFLFKKNFDGKVQVPLPVHCGFLSLYEIDFDFFNNGFNIFLRSSVYSCELFHVFGHFQVI